LCTYIGKDRRYPVSRPTVLNFLLCTQQFKIKQLKYSRGSHLTRETINTRSQADGRRCKPHRPGTVCIDTAAPSGTNVYYLPFSALATHSGTCYAFISLRADQVEIHIAWVRVDNRGFETSRSALVDYQVKAQLALTISYVTITA